MERLSTEVLHEIFLYLKDEYSSDDLFSALMVNRRWCKIVVPILWEAPFNKQNYNKQHSKCIRTYLSNAEEKLTSVLITHGVNLSSCPKGTVFDYASYLRHLPLLELLQNIKYYFLSPAMLADPCKHMEDDSYFKNLLVFAVLCILFTNHSTYIRTLRIVNDPDLHPLNVVVARLLNLSGATISLSGLQYFQCHSLVKEDIAPLYRDMAEVCKGVVRMDINSVARSEEEALSSLIRAQKNLKYLTIRSEEINFIPAMEAIRSQSASLIRLRLECLFLDVATDEALDAFKSCSKLRSLILRNCYELECPRVLEVSKSFPLLEEFYYGGCFEMPEEFIIGILKTSSVNLRRLTLKDYTPGVIVAITTYCKNLEDLFLLDLDDEEILSIFRHCTKLKNFTFNGGDGLEADDLFRRLATCVPKTLEYMCIIMELKEPWVFSAEALKDFLDVATNYSFKYFTINHRDFTDDDEEIINFPEYATMTTFNDEHLKVIRKSGINFHTHCGYVLAEYPDFVSEINIPGFREVPLLKRWYHVLGQSWTERLINSL
ncbi:5722_t:CDS:2 [Funneliformis geosporum]|uniref:5722_t:CDS:1 n=1 Tax=Funneliformis geosporum TaxID=1117311 RepID=A0A9W4WTA9_9GLOM|nr:5722_t:CDS:2 [Funneliformis geosporum]